MGDSVDITKTHVPIIYVIVIVGAIVGGAVAVVKSYNAQAWEVRELREKMNTVATKEDVVKAADASRSELRDFSKERVKFYLEHAALRVTRIPGKSYSMGKLEFPIKEDNE